MRSSTAQPLRAFLPVQLDPRCTSLFSTCLNLFVFWGERDGGAGVLNTTFIWPYLLFRSEMEKKRKKTKRRKGKKEERQRTCVKRRGCSPGAAARQSGYLCISIRTSESCRGVQLSYLCDRGISQNLNIAVTFLRRCFLLLIFCFFKQKCAGKPAHICC